MAGKKVYNGLDVVKFILALLIAQRHIVQIYFGTDSKWRILIGNWLSNLGVPVFFTIAGFFLFCKLRGKPHLDNVQVRRYCGRILRLYVTWSVLYLPIDWYIWYHGERDVAAGLLDWLHKFVFCSSIVQLWYLPALALACWLVWKAYQLSLHPLLILAAGAVFLAIGVIGDNWYFNQRLPEWAFNLLWYYLQVFVTLRNGIFYGLFYVALGLCLALYRPRVPLGLSLIGFLVSFAGMFAEVWHFTDPTSYTNFVIGAAPSALFLFLFASALPLKNRPVYRRLRGMSEWIYLSHFYFFYFLGWLRPWIPVLFTSKTVTLMIMIPLLIFAWAMTRLSETEKGRWLRMLV